MQKINGADPNELSNVILSERETRMRIYAHAVELGCGEELKKLFRKYDALMKNCSNEQERKDKISS